MVMATGYRVFLASSPTNTRFTSICNLLRRHGHTVHDWRSSFDWKNLDHLPKEPSAWMQGVALGETAAMKAQMDVLQRIAACEVCVLLMPAGRSSCLIAGEAHGRGKRLIVYLTDGETYDVGLVIADKIVINDEELVRELSI